MGKYAIHNIDSLRKRMDDINEIMNSHKVDRLSNDLYWAPRHYSGNKTGATLYLAGGDFIHLEIADDTCENSEVKEIQQIDDKRLKFFEVENFAVKPLGEYSYDDILQIYKSFLNWVEYFIPEREKKSEKYRKNPNYERRWQTRIANENSCKGTPIEVFDVEFETELKKEYWFKVKNSAGKYVDHKVSKPDLMGVQKVNDSIVLYFIEYKCTNAGITGNVSLPEHLADMYHSFREEETIEKAIDQYNNHMRLLGFDNEIIRAEEMKRVVPRILFVFSHVNTELGGKKMTSEQIARHYIDAVIGRDELKYSYNELWQDVYYYVIEDISKPVLLPDKFFQIEDTRENMLPYKNPEGRKVNKIRRRKINEIKKLFE